MKINKKIEENLLGYVLRNGNPTCLFTLKGKFHYSVHNDLCDVLIALYQANTAIDLLSVSHYCETHKIQVDLGILAQIFNADILFETDHAVAAIEESWKKRSLERLMVEAKNKLETEDARSILSEVAEQCINLSVESNKKSTIEAAFDEIADEMESYLEARRQGRKTIGIPVGYKLDILADGLRPAHLWAIAAYTSAGKTTFMVNLAKNILEQGHRVVIYSLEATKTDIMSKFIALDTSMSPREVLHAAEDNAQYEIYTTSRDRIKSKYDLAIHDDKHDIDDIVLSMRQENAKKHVDAFFLDYVQNLTSKNVSDEYNKLTAAMSTFKLTLKGTKSPLILFSQISNEDSRTKNSLLMNGKGSGSIKSASSLFAYMKPVGTDEEILKYYETGVDVPFDLIVNKNQHGKIGTISMRRVQKTGEIYQV